MPPQLQLLAVAFISPQNHPLLIRSFSSSKKNDLKYHYIAHTSLDVIEERSECNWHPHYSNALINKGLAGPSTKTNECYLGLLYAMEDVAVYGYMTPLKVKIVLTLALTDSVVRDADVTMVSLLCRDNGGCSSPLLQIFRAFHMAYFHALANPFLRLDTPYDAASSDHAALLVQNSRRWKGFRQRVDDVARAVGVNVTADDDD